MRKAMSKGQKGFTLVELMAVVAILAVLAAIVFPAVTGTTTSTRGTSQGTDINSVQTGVDRFNSESTSGNPYPTKASVDGSSTSAGALPTGSATGSGTSSSPYVFAQDDITGIDFSATTTTSAGTETFHPDFLRTLPDHDAETITVANNASSSTFTIVKVGEDVYVKLSNTSGGTLNFDAWGVDKDGEVWVFVDKDSY